MDINFSKEDLAFRDELRDWLANDYPKHVKNKMDKGEHLTRQDMVDYHKALSAKGWMGYNWPVEYGGTGWTATQLYLFNKEFGLAGCPPLLAFGVSMVAPVIYTFGNDEQKKRFLPDILDFNTWWCQGYSEPGSNECPKYAGVCTIQRLASATPTRCHRSRCDESATSLAG